MKLPLYQVDAFAKELYKENPAAVVLCSSELPEETMQAIAAENNLAETAFVEAADAFYHIRWSTPTVEVDLCGHATLAAAHVLFNHRDLPGDTVTFSSRSGLLHVRKEEGTLYLDFPADSITEAEAPQSLLAGLGVEPLEVYRGRDDFLVILDNEEIIVSLRPDMAAIAQIPARGVIVSAPDREVDFVSRFFGPQSGIPEDPVTGSAHTTLTPYWAKRLGKEQLNARQLSPRGGELTCKDLDLRVEIGGNAVTYLVGAINV